MKFLLGLCLSICIILGANCIEVSKIAEELKGEDPNILDCAIANKIYMKTLDDIKKNKKFPNTPEMQCFMACMMKKKGMMNDDGTFTKQFTESKASEVCKDLNGKNTCEIAFKAVDCLLNNNLIILMAGSRPTKV